MSIDNGAFIKFPEPEKGVLLKRYKRFLADILLDSGETITAHCPNTGSMLACSEPGRPVWVSLHDNPGRKYKYSWDIIDMGTSLVGVSTSLPNRLVKLAVEKGDVAELKGYDRVRPEVKTSEGSRLDLCLEKEGRRSCFVEIKNCTMVTDGIACFPDAVTKRGKKHLLELKRLSEEGHRTAMFYFIQRMDAKSFEPAVFIDPDYAKTLSEVAAEGVEIIVYDVKITIEGVRLGKKIPFRL